MAADGSGVRRAARVVRVDSPADLGPAAVLAVADGARLALSDGLRGRLAASREATVLALGAGGPVYGVSTGLGGQAHLAVGAAEQPAFQGDLMLARSVGTAPWLDRRSARAATATRLRTLLEPEVGVSPDLVAALVAVLDADLHPAVPATGNGAAGEIIPLAHLGAFLSGRGEGLADSGAVQPAAALLGDAGLAPYRFQAKEGVAFLQGVPVAAARAVLLGAGARLLVAQALTAAAAEITLVRAPRDPYHPALARGDVELAAVLGALRSLVGAEPAPRSLQAPVSFRVVGPALACLLRAVGHLDEAVERSLAGVTTSPALVDGRFLGTSGFDGFDLAAAADAVRLAVLHVAETGAARLHRLMDPRVTGLPPQLSAAPGRQSGLVALHKRAVGLVHEARRTSAPASLGALETSLGQEDVQSFALEALAAGEASLQVLRDVTACELVAVHQARLLDETVPAGSERLRTVLRKAFADVPDGVDDRPPGPDVTAVVRVLDVGWSDELVGEMHDSPSHFAPAMP
jgi:histidine ammonia-lyase